MAPVLHWQMPHVPWRGNDKDCTAAESEVSAELGNKTFVNDVALVQEDCLGFTAIKEGKRTVG